MNLFPKTHEDFINWCKSIASDLQISSKGQMRVGYNKLAATMAKTLPNTKADFNINTLKSLFNKPKSFENIVQQTKISREIDKESFLQLIKGNLRTYFEEKKGIIAKLLTEERDTYLIFELESSIFDYLLTSTVIDNEILELASRIIPIIDPVEFNAAYRDYVHDKFDINKLGYLYINELTTKFAYREILTNNLIGFLEELAEAYKAIDYQNLELDNIEEWIINSFDAWQGNSKFNPDPDHNPFKIN